MRYIMRVFKWALDYGFVRFTKTNGKMRLAASRCPSLIFWAWRCVESVVLRRNSALGQFIDPTFQLGGAFAQVMDMIDEFGHGRDDIVNL